MQDSLNKEQQLFKRKPIKTNSQVEEWESSALEEWCAKESSQEVYIKKKKKQGRYFKTNMRSSTM